jgi:hypothetical protein
MTIQIKHFIELSDIVSMRFDCRHCKASITVPFAEPVDTRKFCVCPQCSEPWARLPNGSTMELTIEKLVSALREMRQALEWRATPAGQDSGFAFLLEIDVPEAD